MRRQKKAMGEAVRWAVNTLDLDPFNLPIRYTLPLCGVLGQCFSAREEVVIGRKSVLIKRSMFGLTFGVERVLLSSFEGVSISVSAQEGHESTHKVSISLVHNRSDLCFPLFADNSLHQAGARWQALGRVLHLPLMVRNEAGAWTKPFERELPLGVYEPISRRPALLLSARRPRITKFRDTGASKALCVLRGAEIIARD